MLHIKIKIITITIQLKQKTMMTNLLHNINNNILDQNFLNYGLLLGSVSILGYSIYYFTGYFNNNTVDSVLPNLNRESLGERIVENLNVQPITSPDTVVPYLSKEILESLSKVESAVQTDTKMLYEYLKELLYNQCTPTTSLGEISPSDFVREYRNDPNLASYFEKTANWAESISRQSSGTSANSEVLFMRKVNEDIRNITELISNNLTSENITSPVSEIALSNTLYPNSLLDINYEILLNKLYNISYIQNNVATSVEDLRNTLELYLITLNESNFYEVVHFFTG